MSEITVRTLDEDGWADFRTLRLAALEESPQAFTASYADEVDQPEEYWRDSLRGTKWLLAANDEDLLGLVAVVLDEEAATADIRELWVTPKARSTGVASRLVQAAADQAVRGGCTKAYYWVSTENARAIAFAINAGFRVTSDRRTSQVENEEFGDQEILLVMPLGQDPAAGPTASPSPLISKSGPR